MIIATLLLALAPQGSTYTVTPTDPQHVHGVEADTNWTPSAPTLTLKNSHPLNSVSYTVSCPENWITLSSTSGTINANKQKVVTLTIDSDADSLAAGFYDATVTVTMGAFSFERHVYLSIVELAAPGSGWSGATSEPGQIGSGTAKCIARWDVVPFQTIEDDANWYVGVVAFHIAGIDRVEVSVENGTWVQADEMIYNPRTGVWEYAVALQRSDWSSDGPIELRAIAYPKSAAPGSGSDGYAGGGYPRLLDSLHLYVDAGTVRTRPVRWVDDSGGSDDTGDGSESNPFQSLGKAAKDMDNAEGDCDNGLIYCKAGTSYSLDRPTGTAANTVYEYLTVTHAPGLDRDDVVIDNSVAGAIGPNKLRLLNVTVKDPVDDGNGDGDAKHAWLDGCHYIGFGQHDPHTGNVVVNAGSITNCDIEQMRGVFVGKSIARNCTLDLIGSEAFGRTELTVNCTVLEIDRENVTAFHPDVWACSQNTGTENRIAYGLRAWGDMQGLFIKDNSYSNFAFVNVYINDGDQANSQIQNTIFDHILYWHVTLVGQDFLWRSDEVDLTNVSYVGCVADKMDIGAGGDSIGSDWCAWNQSQNTGGETPGTDYDEGSAELTDGVPSSTSPLLNRLGRVVVPVDINGKRRPSSPAVGAFEEQ